MDLFTEILPTSPIMTKAANIKVGIEVGIEVGGKEDIESMKGIEA